MKESENIELYLDFEISTIYVKGILLISDEKYFKKLLLQSLERDQINIDFSECTNIDSHILAMLINFHKTCIKKDKIMYLKNVNGNVEKLLKITNLRNILNVI